MRRLALSLPAAAISAAVVFAGVALAVVPPGNDDFANRQAITGAAGSATGTTVASTLEANESSFFTEWDSNPPEYQGGVWYSWTAPAGGPVAFRTTNIQSGTDTILGAATGTGITDLQTVDFNDDYPSCCPSRILFNAVNGTTYYIGVGPLWTNPEDYGTFTLEWGGAGVNYFDQQRPNLTATATGGKNTLTINFSASDDTAAVVGSSWLGVTCTFNGSTYSNCASPFVAPSGGGKRNWSVEATDGAGNVRTVSGTTRVKGRKNLP